MCGQFDSVGGVLLAGGSGLRLHPATAALNKHLLNVYDKPMIYYSLSTLLLSGIRDISLVTNPKDQEPLVALLGDGSRFGISITYETQLEPRGIVDGLIACAERMSNRKVVVALGDNLLHGPGLGRHLEGLVPVDGARVLATPVADAQSYGVVQLSASGAPLKLIEKPEQSGPGLAIVGLYFYGADAIELAQELQPSSRGELEITDLNSAYLAEGRLSVDPLPRGVFWQDLGSPETLFSGSEYVRLLESRTGLFVGCPEEIAWRNGWITDEDLQRSAAKMQHSAYGRYLASLPEADSNQRDQSP